MKSRQRIKTLLGHREADRVGMDDSLWQETVSRWRAEGLPMDASPGDYFGYDIDYIYMDTSLRLPDRLVKETEDYTIREDKHGFTTKVWKGRSGALGYLDHVVKSPLDWERLRMNLTIDYGRGCRMSMISNFDPFVVWPEWRAFKPQFDALRLRDKYVLCYSYGPWEAIWRMHGFEQSLLDVHDNPTFIGEMANAHVDLVIATLARARDEGIVPDGYYMGEDLGYRSGTLFSPRSYRDVLWPAQRRLGDYLHSQNISFFMHTDGDIRAIIPDLIGAGIEVLQPLEARVGLHVRDLKREYGKDLCFFGNISVEALAGSKEVIEQEVREKVLAAMPGGGYIYHSDHSVPHNVSFEQYQYALQMVRKYGTYV